MRIIPIVSVMVLMAAASMPVAGQEMGRVSMHVVPTRAGVFIDGKYVGPASNFAANRTYEVAAGDHEIKLSEPRYEDLVTRVTVQPGKTTKVIEKLKPLPVPKGPFGTLRTTSSDKFAAVYVNDKFMGHVDEFSNSKQGLLLNPGEYTVKIVPVNGANPKEEKVRIEANKKTLVQQ